jgi:hypothetical protein
VVKTGNFSAAETGERFYFVASRLGQSSKPAGLTPKAWPMPRIPYCRTMPATFDFFVDLLGILRLSSGASR